MRNGRHVVVNVKGGGVICALFYTPSARLAHNDSLCAAMVIPDAGSGLGLLNITLAANDQTGGV